MYEGHFPPLSRLPCHGASLCFAVAFLSVFVGCGRRACAHRRRRDGCRHGSVQRSNRGVCSREHMAPYSIPSGLLLLEELPRNHMGKVNKKDLLRRFFS